MSNYLAELGLVEVAIETPDGRVARGRARIDKSPKRDPSIAEYQAIRDAFEDALIRLDRLSGYPCDCGVSRGRIKGLHHDTTCAMFAQFCTFNPSRTCAQVMEMGNGHCCREYEQYERERQKLANLEESP